MNRQSITSAIVLGCGVLVVAGFWLFSTDAAAARVWLETAHSMKVEGALVASQYQEVFDRSGPSGVGAFPGTEIGKTAMLGLSSLLQARDRPTFYRKDVARDLELSARAFSTLLSEPRGSWLTYSKEIADARTALDRSLALAEMVFSPADIEDAKVKAKTNAVVLATALMKVTAEEAGAAFAKTAAEEAQTERDNAARAAAKAKAEAADSADRARWLAERAAEEEAERAGREKPDGRPRAVILKGDSVRYTTKSNLNANMLVLTGPDGKSRIVQRDLVDRAATDKANSR